MIFVIGQTFVDLCPRQGWKTANDIIHTGAIDDQSNHIMNPNSGAFYDGISSPDTGQVD